MQRNGVAPKSLSESAFLIERCTIQPTLNQVVSHDGRITHLEPKVMQLLVSMAGRPGEVLSRDTLLNLVWGDAFISEQVLTNAISQIRQSFGDAGRDYLQTIPKKGYRLTARVLPESALVSSTPLVTQREEQQRWNVNGNRKRWRRTLLIAFVIVGVVAIAGYSVWRFNHRRDEHKVKGPEIAIAVLPFQNLAGDKGNDHLRFALSGRIATSLTYSPSLYVRPSADTQKYVTGALDLQLAGRELRVGKIVTGEFQYEGNSLRITVELVDVGQNRISWRSTVIAPAQSSLDLERQVTLLVQEQLLPALQVEATPEATHPANADAYNLYLRSLSFGCDPAPNKEAIRLLERAVILDPNYAPLWEQLGIRCYEDSRFSDGGEGAFARAEMAGEQALKLDPNLPSAPRTLVLYRAERGHLNEAWVEAQKFSQRFPDNPRGLFALSYVLRYAGLDEEAARLCDRALAMDLTKTRFVACAITYSHLGEYEKAAQVIREREPPETQFAREFLAGWYLEQGDGASALQNYKEIHDLRGRFMTECLTGTPRKQTAEALEAYGTGNDPELIFGLAGMFAYCGETDRAIRFIRSAIDHNYCGYPLIGRDPFFANVRSRPEYAELRAAAITCQQNFLKFRKSLDQK